MVGTIQNITKGDEGKSCFFDELNELLESHFDAGVRPVNEDVDLFDGSSKWDISIDVKDSIIEEVNNYKITIMETWFSKNF